MMPRSRRKYFDRRGEERDKNSTVLLRREEEMIDARRDIIDRVEARTRFYPVRVWYR
jgi:hypothetical protein